MKSLQQQLHLLGGFRIVSDGRTVAVPTTAAKLIALLAVNDRPMSRSQIAGTVWPVVSEQRAAANLRSIVWRLPAAAHEFVVATGTAIALAERVDVDLSHARCLVRQVLDDRPLANGDVADGFAGSALVTLLCRPLLPEWDDDWLVFERERIRQLHIHALERLAASLLAAGDPLSAVDVGIAVIATEPLRESSHILVIQAHLAAGNRLDARRCYERYRDVVRRELDVEPAFRWTDSAEFPSRAASALRARTDDVALTPP
jgi:DNA-binding SARP family transcriptional activator